MSVVQVTIVAFLILTSCPILFALIVILVVRLGFPLQD